MGTVGTAMRPPLGLAGRPGGQRWAWGLRARRRGLEAAAQSWKWAGGSGNCPHLPAFLLLKVKRTGGRSAFGGSSAPPGGPQEVARAWKSPDSRLSSLHVPRPPEGRDNGPGLATAQLSASPLRPLPARRGEGGGRGRGSALLPGSCAFLKRRGRVAGR